MNIETYNILTLGVSIVAMAVTATIAIAQMRKTARQALQHNRIALFTEYTRRFHELMNHIPEDVFNGTTQFNEQTKKYLRLYFDLCSEEFYISQQKDLLPSEVWQYWQDGMKIMVNNELYRQCWNVLKVEYNSKFRDFMEELINDR